MARPKRFELLTPRLRWHEDCLVCHSTGAVAYAASIAYRDQAMTAEDPDRPQTKITFKRIVTPDVRPDLYDAYDGELYSPHSLDDLVTTTPQHVQRLIERRQGKPFIDVAQEMVADSWRRALIYYEVDGEVFRLVPGRELEKFNQETGEFKPYDGEGIVTRCQ